MISLLIKTWVIFNILIDFMWCIQSPSSLQSKKQQNSEVMAAIEWWIYVLSAYELIHLCKSIDRIDVDMAEPLLAKNSRLSVR